MYRSWWDLCILSYLTDFGVTKQFVIFKYFISQLNQLIASTSISCLGTLKSLRILHSLVSLFYFWKGELGFNSFKSLT